jgi:hypothetical protein
MCCVVCCCQPSFAPIDTEILSRTIGPDKIDCPHVAPPFSPVPSRFLAPKNPPSSPLACFPLCPSLPRFAPLVLAGAAAPPARPLLPPILSVGLLAPRPLAGNVRRGKSMENAHPVLGRGRTQR